MDNTKLDVYKEDLVKIIKDKIKKYEEKLVDINNRSKNLAFSQIGNIQHEMYCEEINKQLFKIRVYLNFIIGYGNFPKITIDFKTYYELVDHNIYIFKT